MNLVEVMRSVEAAGLGPRRRRNPRRREIKLRPSRQAAADILVFQRELTSLLEPIQERMRRDLFPLLERLEPQFLVTDAAVMDDFASEIEDALRQMREDLEAVNRTRAESIASNFTARTNKQNRRRFFGSVESVIGIDLSAVVDDGDLGPVLRLKTAENVQLIQSVPEQFLEKIERAVYASVLQGSVPARTLQSRLLELGAESLNRAKFIARDQTAKLTASLNQQRNMALGIEEFIWRTSKDARVRETHEPLDGKRFRFDSPPLVGGRRLLPGQDFQCRCRAQPVVNL